MDIYEKKYNEAIKRAKQHCADYIVETIFPELAESEDKRIRKDVISFVVQAIDAGYGIISKERKEKWITWLEKQGNLMGALQESNKKIGELVEENYYLKKQGEQKPYGQRQECVDCQFNYVGECKGSCVMKRGEQKPADKIEPKFHEGEWITNSAVNPAQISSIKDGMYFTHNDTIGSDIKSMDKEYHLWTIQDAKDSDVLVLNNEVLIYAHRKQMYSIAVAHCFVDSAGNFYLDGEFGYTEKGNSIHPASKEQRDLLFSKMKEAGYEWDTEKKELRKIEHNPAWSEEDVAMLDSAIAFVEHSPFTTIGKGKGGVVAWLKSLKDRVQPKQEWSERDSQISKAIIKKLGSSDALCVDLQEAISWVSSVKDRVQPQPKQEWSEEDKENFELAIYLLEKAKEDAPDGLGDEQGLDVTDYKNVIKWLKSLRPQNRWKPSDEQMVALESATENCAYSEYQDCLRELIGQLKKLTE